MAAWLDKYMFASVDENEKKGEEIASWLGDAEQHKSHGRPISCELAGEQGLEVKALEDDQMLQDLVLTVFHAAEVTYQTTDCVKVIENNLGKGSYILARIQVAPNMIGFPVPPPHMQGPGLPLGAPGAPAPQGAPSQEPGGQHNQPAAPPNQPPTSQPGQPPTGQQQDNAP